MLISMRSGRICHGREQVHEVQDFVEGLEELLRRSKHSIWHSYLPSCSFTRVPLTSLSHLSIPSAAISRKLF